MGDTMSKLRIILAIPPYGFTKGQEISVNFTDKKTNNLYRYTGGEGQALQFVLEEADLSTNFAKALRDGRFLETANDFKFGHFELRFVPTNKSIKLVDYDSGLWMDEIMDGLDILDEALEKTLGNKKE